MSQPYLDRCTNPAFEARWVQICAEHESKQNAWVEQMRELGCAAAHPDDGWVDRRKNTVFLCYPYFERKPVKIGDRIALGDADKHRIVVVTEIIKPIILTERGNTYRFTAAS